MTRLLPLAAAALAAPALAQTPPHDHTMPMPPPADHSQHTTPPPDHAPHQPAPDHQDMDHSQMDHGQMDHGHGDRVVVATTMRPRSALGPYPMTRDASGTAWQPDAAEHGGVHAMAGDWMLMGHAELTGVYSSQGGPRGDDKAFLAGMFMGSARRSLGESGTLQLRAMLSPDPFMGRSGYPLLLAAGETADGVDTLVDRQHPHDLFMELSASYAHRLSETDSVFVYAGLPGEPAFGPPAFMHRPASQESPEAPITHHWLDSTHITFGVVTAGWVHDGFKLEASRFRGREPDQDRYDIETGDLDSTAVRVSWNPTHHWSLQASWADVTSPEQLEPDVDETKWSTSALFTADYGFGEVAATAAFGRKQRSDGVDLDAWLGEASWRPAEAWTLFGRAEHVETDELGAGHHGPVETAAKVSLGVIRDWRVSEHVVFGVGALVARNFTDDTLDALYGGDPWGGMAFVRLKVG
jgi:hypothetical protein